MNRINQIIKNYLKKELDKTDVKEDKTRETLNMLKIFNLIILLFIIFIKITQSKKMKNQIL